MLLFRQAIGLKSTFHLTTQFTRILKKRVIIIRKKNSKIIENQFYTINIKTLECSTSNLTSDLSVRAKIKILKVLLFKDIKAK